MVDREFDTEPDTYWESDRVNDRDEWDAHVRAVDEDERDRLTRDLPARQTSPSLRGTTERREP